MRVQRMAGGMVLVAMLVACNKHPRTSGEAQDGVASNLAASPVPLGQIGKATASEREAPAQAGNRTDEWTHAEPFDMAARLIVRTGDPFETNRLISSLALLANVPCSPAQARSCSGSGHVIYRATLNDGSQHVVAAQLP